MLRSVLWAALGAWGFGAWAWVGAKPEPESPPAGRVNVILTVDWEGAYLDPSAMTALRRFDGGTDRRAPLTHFLNPAYYTKEGVDEAEVTRRLRTVIGPRDALALHVHGWRSLVERSKVRFRSAPRFMGEPELLAFEDGDQGFEVALTAYSVPELESILTVSQAILQAHGFRLGAGFRVAGGVASPELLQAVRKRGLTWDSSALAADWLDEVPALQAAVKASWPGITPESQPYWVETKHGRLLEFPATGAMADYLSAEEMADHVSAAVRRSAETRKPAYVLLGLHQETADVYAPRLESVLRAVRRRHPDALRFTTLDRAAQAWTSPP